MTTAAEVAKPMLTRKREEARSRKRARWARRALWITLGLALVALIVYAWIPKPVPVEVQRAKRGEMRVSVLETGKTRVKDRYVISAPLTGEMERVELHAGDTVEGGAVVARIVPMLPALLDPRTRAEAESRVGAALAGQLQARASVDRAQSAADQAKSDLDNDEKLFGSGSISSREIEHARLQARLRDAELRSAKFASNVAEHEVGVAQAALRRIQTRQPGAEEHELDVTAPVSGRVFKVIQQSGGVIAAGAPILEVGDPAALEIVTDVLTQDAVRIVPGTHATIEQWGGPPLAAHVRLVEPSAFMRISALGVEEQRVNVVIDLDEPRDKWQALGDGYRIEARMVVWEQPNVLRVPAGAVFRHGDGWAVYVVERGRVHLRTVKIGERSESEVQIVDGLQEGAVVVVHPSDRVADGVRATFK